MDRLLHVVFETADELQSLKQARKDLEFVIKKGEIQMAGIQKGLETYKLLSFADNDLTVKNLTEATETFTKKVSTAKNRNCLFKYLRAAADQGKIESAMEIIDLAYNAISSEASLISVANKKWKTNNTLELNKKVKQILKNQDALQFWKKHVNSNSYPIPIPAFSTYFENFISIYNSGKKQNRFSLQYVQPIIIEIFDRNGNNVIGLNEIQNFFQKYWTNEKNREQLREVFEEFAENDVSKNNEEYIFTYQMLLKAKCEENFSLFVYYGITGKLLLELDYSQLKTMLVHHNTVQETDLIKLSQKIKKHKDYKVIFQEIKNTGQGITQEINSLVKTAYKNRETGVLKEVSKDNYKGHFETSSGYGVGIKQFEDYIEIGEYENFQPLQFSYTYIKKNDGTVIISKRRISDQKIIGYQITYFPDGSHSYSYKLNSFQTRVYFVEVTGEIYLRNLKWSSEQQQYVLQGVEVQICPFNGDQLQFYCMGIKSSYKSWKVLELNHNKNKDDLKDVLKKNIKSMNLIEVIEKEVDAEEAEEKEKKDDDFDPIADINNFLGIEAKAKTKIKNYAEKKVDEFQAWIIKRKEKSKTRTKLEKISKDLLDETKKVSMGVPEDKNETSIENQNLQSNIQLSQQLILVSEQVDIVEKKNV